MRETTFNWGPGLFLIIYQSLLMITLPIYFYYYTPSISLIAISFVLLYLTGLSITAGYHRFYSHRAYKTRPIIETILLFFGSMAGQGSALRWSFDHRLHHAHVDTDNDPYSINKGFWYAHFLWILEKPRDIDPKLVPDLIRNPLVQFQHKHAPLLMLGTNALAFLVVGFLLNDYMGAFFIALWLRLFALHHFTWFINSLAHTWGDKPFCHEQTAVNNYVIALLTFGEGYHNFHHTYANDYRNGIRWYHFDPTKWLIWGLSKCGLATNLKKVDPYTIKRRMIMERKRLLLEKSESLWYVKKSEVEQIIHELSDKLVTKFNEINVLMESYRQYCQEGIERARKREIKMELSNLKKSIKQDWRVWKRVSKELLRLKPVKV